MSTSVDRLSDIEFYAHSYPTKGEYDGSYKRDYNITTLSPQELVDVGINVSLLVPKDPNKPIMITCRGTKKDASVIADLDPTAPGFEQLHKHLAGMMPKIAAVLANHPTKEIVCAGHSLGGALADQIMAEILYRKDFATKPKVEPLIAAPQSRTIEDEDDEWMLVDSEEDDVNLDDYLTVAQEIDPSYHAFAALSSVNLSTFNAPGVSASTRERASINAQSIKERYPEFKIEVNRMIAHRDIVSKLKKNILDESPPNIADVQVVKQNTYKAQELSEPDSYFNWIIQPIKNRKIAHTAWFFDGSNTSKEKDFEIMSNDKNPDGVKEQLGKDILGDGNGILGGFRSFIQRTAFNRFNGITNEDLKSPRGFVSAMFKR